MVGTIELTWYTVSIPSFIADLGDRIWTNSPSTRTSPASGRSTPESTLIKVDLPAPLSPTKPTSSPAWNSRSMPSRAWTPEYHLCRPLTEMIGVATLKPPP